MRDYSTQAARHRRPEKKGPSAVVGITLSILLLGSVATGLIWLNKNTSAPYPAESQQPEAQVTEPQSQEAEHQPTQNKQQPFSKRYRRHRRTFTLSMSC